MKARYALRSLGVKRGDRVAIPMRAPAQRATRVDPMEALCQE